jgi:hypothetical protein
MNGGWMTPPAEISDKYWNGKSARAGISGKLLRAESLVESEKIKEN